MSGREKTITAADNQHFRFNMDAPHWYNRATVIVLITLGRCLARSAPDDSGL
jgi:hypothetical protein